MTTINVTMDEESGSECGEECQCCQRSLENEAAYHLEFIGGDIAITVCLECYEDEMGDLAEELENLETK